MSVRSVAEIVREAAADELVKNPYPDETVVEEFGVDVSKARERLGWEPKESVSETVRRSFRQDEDD